MLNHLLGVGSVLSLINAPNKLASDLDPYVCCLMNAIQDGWLPPSSLTEETYKEFQNNKPLEPMTAFIGYGCSFGGKWFGGFARSKKTKRSYINEAARGLKKRLPGLVKYRNCSYNEIEVPENSVVYLDPPYSLTTKVGSSNSFDNIEFWKWAENLSKTSFVFVSEYNAPQGWTCIWEKSHKDGLVSKKGNKTEKLWVYNEGIK